MQFNTSSLSIVYKSSNYYSYTIGNKVRTYQNKWPRTVLPLSFSSFSVIVRFSLSKCHAFNVIMDNCTRKPARLALDKATLNLPGIGSSGKGQSQLHLEAAVTYYTTVRAVTGAGHVLESATDGTLVDVTAPVAEITSLGGQTLNRTDARTVSTEVLYQKEADAYTLGWHVDDRESGVSGVWFRVGTTLGKSER